MHWLLGGISHRGGGSSHRRFELLLILVVRMMTVDVNPRLQVIQLDGFQRALNRLSVFIRFSSGTM